MTGRAVDLVAGYLPGVDILNGCSLELGQGELVGGEGLGGEVTRASFAAADGKPAIAQGEWSAPVPMTDVAGKGARGWVFPTIVVSEPGVSKKRQAQALTDVAVEFEFSEGGKAIIQTVNCLHASAAGLQQAMMVIASFLALAIISYLAAARSLKAKEA